MPCPWATLPPQEALANREEHAAWPWMTSVRSSVRCCRSRIVPRSGLVTYDAKDPDTSFAPIEELRPPAGAPNVLVVLIDDVGFGASSAFGGPCATPNAERLAAGGLKFNRFHTTALCSPTRAALLSGRNHHMVGMGGHHRDRDGGAGVQLDAAEHVRAAGGDPQAQRLLDRAVRQVPRGAGVADEPDGAVRQLADRRRRLRVLLRVHRRRGAPVLPGAVRGHDAGRARPHARRGLPPDGRHDRQGDRLGPPAEVADARQAVLRLLRAGRDARAAPRAEGVGGQVRGPVRRRLGRAARADLRAPEGARRDPAERRAHAAPRADPGVGRDARGRSSRCCAARWRSTPASWSSPTTTSGGCSTRSTTSRCSTTRSSTTSSATTAPRPRAR